MRRALRFLWRAVLALMTTSAATLAVVALLLQSDCGKERIRQWAEARLDRAVHGEASIARARLTLGGKLELEGVVIRDTDGRPVISANAIALDFDWLPLLRKELHASRAAIDGLEVNARVSEEGEVDIAALFRRDEKPSPWSMTFGTVELRRGIVSVGYGDQQTSATLTDLEALGRARVWTSGAVIDVERVAGRWREESLPFAGSAQVVLDGSTYTGRYVAARLGELEIATPWLHADIATRAMVGSLWIRSPASELRRIPVPELRSHWRGDVDVMATVRCRDWAQPCHVAASGDVGDGSAELDALMSLSRPSLAGRIVLSELSPASVLKNSPDGRVAALVLTGSVTGASFDTVLGIADAAASGVFETTRISDAKLHVECREHGRFTVSAEATTEYGKARGKASVHKRPDEVWVVEQSNLEGESSSLAALLEGSAAVDGRARLVLSATGEVSSLAVEGVADVWDGRTKSMSARRLHLQANASGVSGLERPTSLSGRLSLWARGAAIESHEIGNLKARGRFADFGRRLHLTATSDELRDAEAARSRVAARIAPARTTIQLTNTLLDAGGATWRGKGGTIVVRTGGRVDVRGLDLTSTAGRVQASGEVDPGRDLRRAAITAENLDLTRLPPTLVRAVSARPLLSGKANAEATVSRQRGQTSVDGSARVRRLSWRAHSPPIDAVAEIHATPGYVSATGTLSAPRGGGSVVARVATRAPRTPFDLAAWRRLSASDIDRAKLELNDVAVAVAAEVLALDLPVSAGFGFVDGVVELPPVTPEADQRDGSRPPAEPRHAQVDVGCRAVAIGGVDRLSARLRGSWSDRALTGTALLEHRKRKVAEGPLTLDLGFSQLWTRAASELASTGVRGRAALSGLDLARFREVGLAPVALSGKLSGTLVLRGTLMEPTIELRKGVASKVRVAGIRFQRVALSGSTAGRALTVTARGDQAGGGHVRGRASYSWGADSALTARASASHFRLDAVRGLHFGDPELLASVAGQLDGNVRLTGWPEAPAVTGHASIAGGEITIEGGTRHVRNASLVLRFAGAVIHIDRLEARPGSGRVSGKGTINLVGLSPDRFSLTVTTRKLPLTIGDTSTKSDLAGTLAGRLRDGRIAATARVREGTIRLSAVNRKLQRLSPLEDVVFADERGSADSTSRGPPDVELRVQVPKGIRVTSEILDALVTADLQLAFTDGRTTWIAGKVDVQRGTYELLDRRYRIRRGHAELDGTMPPNPTLDIELWRQFPSTGIVVNVSGSFDEPRAVLSAESGGYDDTQILIIMLGEDPEDPEIANRPIEDQAWGAAGAILSRRVKKHLRVVDVLRTGNDSVEIGRWVTKDLLIGYRERYSSNEHENPRELTFEYRLLRRVMIEARGGANIAGGDLVWVLRW